MYIPLGPSKKDLYKIIIGLLLIVYLLFLGMYKPKALENKSVLLNGTIVSTNNYGVYHLSSDAQNELHYDGFVMFNVYSVPYCVNGTCQPTKQIKEIQLDNNYSYSTCEIGNQLTYNDNTSQVIGYSVKCPIQNKGTYGSIIVRMVDAPIAVVFSNHMGIYADSNSSSSSGGVSQSSFDNYSAQLRNDLGTILTAIESGNNQTSAISNAINSASSQAHQDAQDIKDTLNDSSIDSSSANDFTNNSAFQDSNGLDAIIKAPLNFIRSLTSSTCSSINLTIPYIDADVSLPCMSTIYNKALGSQLVNLIALVINGVVLYRYCLKILQIVKDAKNPNKDGLEVLDL